MHPLSKLAIQVKSGYVRNSLGFLPLCSSYTSNLKSIRESSNIRFIDKTDPSSLKRGSGGRSSFSGVVTTVFGASGFIGIYVCSLLGKNGTQMIIPYRGDHHYVKRIKLMGDLGQVLFLPYESLADDDSIRKAVKHSHVVINLVGRDWNTRHYTMEQVNVEGAAKLARICKEMGVKKFIHMSALNSNMKHEGFLMKGGSEFLRTKAESEEAVRKFFPEAVIFRPSDVYGQQDRFLGYYLRPFRYTFKYLLPVPNGGKDIWKQPVWVGDLAEGIVKAALDPETEGKIFEAVGPRRYELKELLEWLHRVTRRNAPGKYFALYDLKYDPIAQIKARLFEYSISSPINFFTRDKIEREAVTDTTFELPTLEDLGVKLAIMEDRVPWEVARFKADLYYDEYLGEFDKPAPPKYVPA